MIFEHESYKTYLRAVLMSKIAQNPQFSLRSFAVVLGVSHAALSQVINGEKNFSLVRATEIANRLKLKVNEKQYFCLLVQYDTCKKPEIKNELREKIYALRQSGIVHNMSLDVFKVISDWYHFAIIALLRLDIPLPPEEISEKLGISPLEAQTALERMERLNLIRSTGEHRYTKNKSRVRINSNNNALDKFFKQMIMLSYDSVDQQELGKERITGGETFIMKAENLERVKALTYEFLDSVGALVSPQGEKGELYHVHVNCFKLTKKSNVKTKISQS